jgi:hypothetical protein
MLKRNKSHKEKNCPGRKNLTLLRTILFKRRGVAIC